MATRWSHAHGELYLRRKWDDGGVEDVEELTVVLWLRGIGQWCSVRVIWLGGVMVFPAAVLAEEGDGRGEMAR